MLFEAFEFESNCSLSHHFVLEVTFPVLYNKFSGFFLTYEAGLRGISENLFLVLLSVNFSLKFCDKFERKAAFNVKCLQL